jgi:hypothetical protein
VALSERKWEALPIECVESEGGTKADGESGAFIGNGGGDMGGGTRNDDAVEKEGRRPREGFGEKE